MMHAQNASGARVLVQEVQSSDSRHGHEPHSVAVGQPVTPGLTCFMGKEPGRRHLLSYTNGRFTEIVSGKKLMTSFLSQGPLSLTEIQTSTSGGKCIFKTTRSLLAHVFGNINGFLFKYCNIDHKSVGLGQA